MANLPTIRQVAWISLIPQILLIGIIIYVFYLLSFADSLFFGVLTYLILSFGLRSLIAKDHRKGISLVKQQKFAGAMPYFERSVNYFSGHSWVDNYRFLTLLSSSKMSYREMGMCNIAFCYSQIGNGLKAKEFYQRVLADYPENGMAQAALNMINSSGTIQS